MFASMYRGLYTYVLLAFAHFCTCSVNCIVRVHDMQGPSYIDIPLLKGATFCVLENEALTSLNFPRLLTDCSWTFDPR